MTKGELEAYVMLRNELVSLIKSVEDYCRSYDLGQGLKITCKYAKETLAQADKSFNKGKRKK